MKRKPMIPPNLQLALSNRIAEIDLPIQALESMPPAYCIGFFKHRWILVVFDLPCGGCETRFLRPVDPSK